MTTKPGRILNVDFSAAEWKKSSYSQNAGGNCVEFADLTAISRCVAIRDSKDPSGPALLFSPAAFSDFVADVAVGRFDF